MNWFGTRSSRRSVWNLNRRFQILVAPPPLPDTRFLATTVAARVDVPWVLIFNWRRELGAQPSSCLCLSFQVQRAKSPGSKRFLKKTAIHVSSLEIFVGRLTERAAAAVRGKRTKSTKTTLSRNMNTKPTVASRADWLAARQALLAEEKQLTRQMDALAARRRALPWVRIDKSYQFETRLGRVTLGELFAGKSQLVIQHFMLGPDWGEGCPSCSYMADHTDGMLPHLAARDVTMVAVSRAPLAEIEAFKQRMGWQFEWVSSHGSEFNHDFNVSFTEEEVASGRVNYNFTEQPFGSTEAPGISVFHKDADGAVHHTYSVYGRGVELMMGTYRILDLVPKGRDEDGREHTMEWVRYHDRYDKNPKARCGCQLMEARS